MEGESDGHHGTLRERPRLRRPATRASGLYASFLARYWYATRLLSPATPLYRALNSALHRRPNRCVEMQSCIASKWAEDLRPELKEWEERGRSLFYLCRTMGRAVPLSIAPPGGVAKLRRNPEECGGRVVQGREDGMTYRLWAWPDMTLPLEFTGFMAMTVSIKA